MNGYGNLKLEKEFENIGILETNRTERWITMKKQWTAILFMLAAVLVFSGCSNKTDNRSENDIVTTSEPSTETAWIETELMVSEDLTAPTSVAFSEDTVYFTAIPLSGGYSSVYAYSMESGQYEEFLKNGTGGAENILENDTAICTDEGNLYVIGYRYQEFSESQFQFKGMGYFLSVYGSSGELQYELELNDALSNRIGKTIGQLDCIFAQQVEHMDGKTLVLFEYDGDYFLLAIDEAGEVVDIKLDGTSTRSVSLAKNAQGIYVSCATEEKIFHFNIEQMSLEIPVDVTLIDSGYDGIAPILFGDNDTLYALYQTEISEIDLNSGAMTSVVDLLEQGISLTDAVGANWKDNQFLILDCSDSGVVCLRQIRKS
jgi:hypothetical protein